MTFHALRTLLLVAAAALLLGGCVDSEQPLSARSAARPDPRLVGTWRSVPDNPSEKDFGRWSFDDHGIGHIDELNKDGTVRRSAIVFFVTRTDKASFLNMQGIFNPFGANKVTNPELYTLFKYRVADDRKTVRFWSLKAATVEHAITTGKLRGKIDRDEHGVTNAVHLQDSSENILKFIESQPDKDIFDAGGTFKKVR